ncbi:MAG TPA: hypothetical protein VFD66_14640 [Verrucomicrobiae bacterium]|nr:hypothetical protein [Verrucomicrobiae bacterium]
MNSTTSTTAATIKPGSWLRPKHLLFAVRSNRMSKGIVLSVEQLAQFKGLIDSAQRNLYSIRTGK